MSQITELLKLPAQLTFLSVETASLNSSSETLVAAVSGRRIRIHEMTLFTSSGSSALVTLDTFGAGAVVIGNFYVNSTVPLVLPFSEVGWMTTESGESLQITEGAAAATTYRVNIAYSTVEPP